MHFKLKEYNQCYIQNTFMGDLENPNIFTYINRDSRVILTAPHSTKTWRKEQIKKSDLYTGAITKYLGEKSNLSTIICNKFSKENFLIHNYIVKHNLTKHFFIDIHGMKNDVDFELAVGLGNMSEGDYNDILPIISALSKKYSIKYVINHPDYTGRFGLTGKLQKISNKPNIIQLELIKDMRDIYHNFETINNKTIPFLSELALQIELFWSDINP